MTLAVCAGTGVELRWVLLELGEDSRFRITMREIKVPWTDDPAADIKAALTELQAQFEDWIRDHPEQWMWSNRRWS